MSCLSAVNCLLQDSSSTGTSSAPIGGTVMLASGSQDSKIRIWKITSQINKTAQAEASTGASPTPLHSIPFHSAQSNAFSRCSLTSLFPSYLIFGYPFVTLQSSPLLLSTHSSQGHKSIMAKVEERWMMKLSTRAAVQGASTRRTFLKGRVGSALVHLCWSGPVERPLQTLSGPFCISMILFIYV